jgi:hypothetical protein
MLVAAATPCRKTCVLVQGPRDKGALGVASGERLSPDTQPLTVLGVERALAVNSRPLLAFSCGCSVCCHVGCVEGGLVASWHAQLCRIRDEGCGGPEFDYCGTFACRLQASAKNMIVNLIHVLCARLVCRLVAGSLSCWA